MDPTLHSLLQRPDIWRAKNGLKNHNGSARPTLATGFAGLDRLLNGGWPRAALTELLLAQTGVGELRLLMPLLKSRRDDQHNKHLDKRISHQTKSQNQPQQTRLKTIKQIGQAHPQSQWPLQHIWIDPPLLPYAPALLQQDIDLNNLLIVYPADRAQWLWTCVQALRSGNRSAVLCWSNRHRLRYAELRQLQVAASEYGSCGFLLRDLTQDRQILQHSTPAPLRLQLRAQAGALSIEVLKQRGHIAGRHISVPQPDALQAQRPLRERIIAAEKKMEPRAPRIAVATTSAEARWS